MPADQDRPDRDRPWAHQPPPRRADAPMPVDEGAPVFVISVAAQLAGMHPQTLRQYDRLGLVCPGRASGRGRRYSARDVATLREVQRLSQDEGVNLAGIKRILELAAEVDSLHEQLRQVLEELAEAHQRLAARHRVFAADPSGGIVAVPPGHRPQRAAAPSTALVVWRPSPRR
jgi:MerR family transcriptional regulator/heat shock protein HspR